MQKVVAKRCVNCTKYKENDVFYMLDKKEIMLYYINKCREKDDFDKIYYEDLLMLIHDEYVLGFVILEDGDILQIYDNEVNII